MTHPQNPDEPRAHHQGIGFPLDEPTVRPQTPELDRQRAVMPQAHEIGRFLDWLTAQGYVLAHWADNEDGDSELWQTVDSPQVLLERFYEIDPTKIEAERRALLDSLREKDA